MKETEEKLLEMKKTSELMLDLAYSALLYHNKEIAEEIIELEDKVDRLYEDIQLSALKMFMSSDDLDGSLIFLKLADAVERFADSALDIADVVLRDIDPHPVLRKSIEQGDTNLFRRKIKGRSFLTDRSLGEVLLRSRTGIQIIAVKRGKKWIYGPDENTLIKEGDILFGKGPEDSDKILNSKNFTK